MVTTVAALAAGAVVGLALGALGGGGSVLAVPALIYLLGFGPAAAATASLVIVLGTAATALYGHARDGQVQWRTGALFAAAGLLPAALGGLLSARLPDWLLTLSFAGVAGVAALGMIRRAPAAPPAGERGGEPGEVAGARRSVPAVVGAGAGLGAVTGVLGVGGGFLTVPALLQVVGLRMRPAVGTSLLVVAVNALVALLARAGGSAPVDWAVVAPFTGAAVLAAWDGRRLASRIPADALRRAFGAVLLAVAALMLLDLAV
ncbi:sulfite exporter TauE/SafE family protein [Streptomyces sp. NPDC004787]|uniref:sulfite exporter TauE/SafE family protein n=1 Tax=Streptomyces sp. NPDC004787 TaxID=3154291 RepID=UPI0033A6A284